MQGEMQILRFSHDSLSTCNCRPPSIKLQLVLAEVCCTSSAVLLSRGNNNTNLGAGCPGGNEMSERRPQAKPNPFPEAKLST